MTIHTCDKCGEEIVREKSLSLRLGFFSGEVVLCKSCSQPLVAFLQAEKLLQQQLHNAGLAVTPSKPS